MTTVSGPIDTSAAPPRREINPLDLELQHRPAQTTLMYRGQPLLTPDGAPVSDELPQVLEVVLQDLQSIRRLALLGLSLELPENFTCYEIHVRRRLQGGPDAIGRLQDWCRRDPILTGTHQNFKRRPEVATALDYFRRIARPIEFSEDPAAQWATSVWECLDDVQQATVDALCRRRSFCLTLTVAFALGGLDTRQYARGVWRARDQIDDVFRDSDAARQFEYFEDVRRDAWKAERYLNARVDQMEARFVEGESTTLEFKATLRKNIHTGKIDGDILNASLRAIAGLLNTEGGTLAIGVTDEGRPTGDIVTLDELRTEDKYLRHLFSKMRDTFGVSVSSTVTARFETFRETSICIVRCSKSLTPVFLTLKDTEEFLIRNGPITESLSIREAIRYIRQRFSDYRG